MELHAKQIEAVEKCFSPYNRIVATTGDPGTGKTQTMQFVYEELHKSGVSVCAVAPTGKAAQRIRELTGVDAMTIHRLLEYPKPKERGDDGKPLVPGVPKRNRSNPVDYDVILADEYPMVGDELHRNLVHALPPGGRLCVFGDVDQLRPIETNKALAGKPSNFEQILSNPKFASTRLTQNFRTGEGALIAQNGRRILRGEIPVKGPGYDVRVSWKPLDDAMQWIYKGDVERWRSLNNQIIVPTKRTWIGTEKLNASLQQHVFQRDVDRSKGYWLPRHKWAEQQVCIYPNDKVIFTQNNYDLEVFNGETGIVLEVNYRGDVLVDFGDRVVLIPESQSIHISEKQVITINPTKDLELAYAITTHKAQGSEYKHCMYLMHKSAHFLCNRRNLYTAATRPRESMTIITDDSALTKSLYDKGDT